MKFHEILSEAAELFHADGRTDGHDGANNRFSKFCERYYKRSFVDAVVSYCDNTTGLKVTDKIYYFLVMHLNTNIAYCATVSKGAGTLHLCVPTQR
jgi:hypothetical protein